MALGAGPAARVWDDFEEDNLFIHAATNGGSERTDEPRCCNLVLSASHASLLRGICLGAHAEKKCLTSYIKNQHFILCGTFPFRRLHTHFDISTLFSNTS